MLQPFGIDRSNSMQPLERGHLQINLNNINIGTLERSVNNPPVPVVPTPKMQ
jgi:hypothetical protein